MFLQLLFHFAPPPLPSLSYFPLKSKDGGILINVYICTLHAFLNQTLNVIKTRGGERGDLVKIFNEISSFLPSLVSGSCTNTRQVPQKFGHIEKKNCLSDGEYHIIGENWTRKVKIMRLASIAKILACKNRHERKCSLSLEDTDLVHFLLHESKL